MTVMASGVPAGLGEPVFDRLDADIAHALMSINAVKGVEIGEGFNVVALRGGGIAMKSRRRVFRATTLAASSVASVAGNTLWRIWR